MAECAVPDQSNGCAECNSGVFQFLAVPLQSGIARNFLLDLDLSLLVRTRHHTQGRAGVIDTVPAEITADEVPEISTWPPTGHSVIRRWLECRICEAAGCRGRLTGLRRTSICDVFVK